MRLPPRKYRRGDKLKAEELNKRLAAPIVAGPGLRISETLSGTVISLASNRAEATTFFWAKTTTHEPVGAAKWRYGFVEVYKIDGGYAGWIERPNGRTSETVGLLYNVAEAFNPDNGDGIVGAGYDTTNFPEGWTLRPVPIGRLVLIAVVTIGDGSKEYWIDVPNVVDGTCAPEPAP